MTGELRPTHPLDRSGFGTVTDLQTDEWRQLYEKLERDQAEFLALEARFRSNGYQWPRDPLHTWSRVWEYPYVYHHLSQRLRPHNAFTPRVADIGSGVTFFPFSLARLGYRVACADIDPVAAHDMERAIAAVPHAPGTIEFRQCTEKQLPFENESLDAVYSISVLEHVADPAGAIDEIVRILVPRGLLILTIDIDLRGDMAIGPKDYASLKGVLEKRFRYVARVRTTHPADLLNNINGLFRTQTKTGFGLHWYEFKQSVKPFLGRPRSSLLPYYLAVEGFALEKCE
jgi:2-polyprenyl-3-methyl-5-hydroxy-6-metoxy-1,4-benzoquinol methylase